MNGSLSLGRFMGIEVRAHWMFLILPVVLLQMWGIEQAAYALIGGFGSVFLHELGHCLVARRFGIRVLDITFWPLGGMARMSNVPEDPKIEALVAIAGPAVNFVLALLATSIGIGFNVLGSPSLAYVAFVLAAINLLMGVFNLIPAFPMDGGRILRAWLGRSTDWVTATEKAVRVGRFFASLMFFGWVALLVGDYGANLCMLPFIAGFVWIAGARELLGVRLRHGVSPFGQAAFGGPQAAAQADWKQATAGADASSNAGFHDAASGARRPLTSSDGESPSQGFSSEFIQKLERSHDRLRRDREQE